MTERTIVDIMKPAMAPSSKGSKKKKPATATTLEACHRQKMGEFDAEYARLDALRKELATLDPESDAAEDLKARIHAIESNEKVLDYWMDVGGLLFQYYEGQEAVARGHVPTRSDKQPRLPSNSIMRFFTEEEDTGSKTTAPKGTAGSKGTKASDLPTDGFQRDKLLDTYLSIVDPTSLKSGLLPGSGIAADWGTCAECHTDLLLFQNEATQSCPECGYEEFVLIDSEKPSYKDPPREVTYFAYRKINHFNEWLAQFRPKESADIPSAVVDALMGELRKQKLSDPKKLNKEKMLELLHKLKLDHMSNQVPKIRIRIQRRMMNLTISAEEEEKLQHMFKEIQPAFIKYCPEDRSNFLSYPYVLYKLCQLLEMDDFLPCFQLLKSRAKKWDMDAVWRKICNEMRWEFIPTV